ncbi:hypothetical protein [Sphingomonas hengshuiensis]|uniref:Uncharacterized protein n=1 Tax=Sphingomonas hengshuiensis TaxID=1609977 RepID=A0A7U4LFY7_9SPHN|nr:hypothetical protein [Sphingomonas hengshuiensis]AJP73002.1 hypothetical protein TS85_16180 [Sphingomonas hengshuiensis]
MESDERYYRRRFAEELAAAKRSVTPAGAERRILLARSFAQRLGIPESSAFGAAAPARSWILELE